MNTQTIFRPSAPLLRAWRFLPYLAQGLAACGQALRQGLLIGSAVLLVACGGGGGGGNGDGDGDPGAPPAPTGFGLNAPTIKTLNFKWDAVAGATHYKLFEDVDGDGIGAEISGAAYQATSYAHETALIYRLNAKYGVRSCNELGCSATSTLAIKADDLNAAIGYAKGANGGAEYGTAIALSKDGNTLAVGAPYDDEFSMDSGAVYVMRRSAAGVWTSPQKLKDTSPTDNEFFGTSLALSANGGVLAVGVYGGMQSLLDGSGGIVATGHVRMFTFDASQAQYILADTVAASNREWLDSFGTAVALDDSGNVLAVGAPRRKFSAASGVGAAYVYTRNGNVWGGEQYLQAFNVEASSDLFGQSIALSGDGKTLAVGAPSENSDLAGVYGNGEVGALDNNNLSNAGAVYVFSRSGTAASDLFADNGQTYIKASNPDQDDRFGTSMALSYDGSVLAVGSVGEDSNGTGIDGIQGNNGLTQNSGAVYVFVRDGVAWSQQAYIKASNTSANSEFGTAFALSSDGNTLAVGAALEKRVGQGIGANANAGVETLDRGAVYVFKRNAGGWSQSAYVKSPTIPSAGSESHFGAAVALSGDGSVLAVGDPFEDNQSPLLLGASLKAGAPATSNGNAEGSGAAYLF